MMLQLQIRESDIFIVQGVVEDINIKEIWAPILETNAEFPKNFPAEYATKLLPKNLKVKLIW